MVNVDNAVVARLKAQGHIFEILVDCENALALREGRNVDIKDVLAAMNVFSDSKKGMEASQHAMEQIFGTSEAEEVARKIIKEGEIQITAEYRNKLRDIKKRQIINLIHRNGVDPKTHYPHPVTRIENALEEINFNADEYAPVEQQLQEALKRLKPILPIKFEVKEISIKLEPQHAPKAYPIIKKYGIILKEEWMNNGYYVALIEMPGGLEDEFYEKMNAICHGQMESKVVKTK